MQEWHNDVSSLIIAKEKKTWIRPTYDDDHDFVSE